MTGWRDYLDGLVLPEGSEALAKHRFDRKAIFFRVCPLEIARLREEVRRLLSAGRDDEALDVTRRIVAFMPLDTAARLGLVSVLAHLGLYSEARNEAERACSSGEVSPVIRARFDALVGDAAWRAGELAIARERYEQVSRSLLDLTSLRIASIKGAIVGDANREPILGPYLMGTHRAGSRVSRSVWVKETLTYLTEAVADLPGDPIALYLLGRRLAIERRHAAALGPVRTALGLLSQTDCGLAKRTAKLMGDELRRIEGVSLVETGEPVAAAERFEVLAAETEWTGRALRFEDWAQRARWQARRSLTP